MEQVDWDVEEFRQWLLTQPLTAIVGTSDECEDCPVARWRASLGEQASVSADTVVFLSSGVERTVPDWVGDFVLDIDRKHADDVLDSDGEVDDYEYRQEPITAEECLDVLELA